MPQPDLQSARRLILAQCEPAQDLADLGVLTYAALSSLGIRLSTPAMADFFQDIFDARNALFPRAQIKDPPA